MSSLAKSVAAVWENDTTLCGLVPFARVFTGRVPQTSLYKFPYVTIFATSGTSRYRSDKTLVSSHLLKMNIWVDGDKLSLGETIGDAITDSYANRCWQIDPVSKVMDMLDGGPGIPMQLDIANIKAWRVTKVFNLIYERLRMPHAPCCDGSTSDTGETSSGSDGESWDRPGSLSAASSGAGAWPQT